MSRIVLYFVGDISLDNKVQNILERVGYENYLNNARILFRDGDIIFGNLESPLTNSKKRQMMHYSKILEKTNRGKAIYLKAKPDTVRYLKYVGFNVLSIANNHILDFCEKGLHDTQKILEDNNILYVGVGNNIREAVKPLIILRENKRIGILAYSYTYEATRWSAGCAPLWKKLILEKVRETRKNVDLLIVSLHFGEEFADKPSMKQRKFCHDIIKCGADIIIGHHSHVTQPIEEYMGKIIAYGLGNFLFGDIYGNKLNDKELAKVKMGTILRVEFTDTQIHSSKMYLINKSSELEISNDWMQQPISNGKRWNNTSTDDLVTLIKILSISLKKRQFLNYYLLFKRIIGWGWKR